MKMIRYNIDENLLNKLDKVMKALPKIEEIPFLTLDDFIIEEDGEITVFSYYVSNDINDYKFTITHYSFDNTFYTEWLFDKSKAGKKEWVNYGAFGKYQNIQESLEAINDYIWQINEYLDD